MPIKHVHEKEKNKFDSFTIIVLSQLLFNYYIEKKDNDFLCQFCFFSICLFWLTPCNFDFLYLQIHATINN